MFVQIFRRLPLARSLSFLAICLLLSPAVAQVANVGNINIVNTPVPGSGHDYIKMLNETVSPASGALSIRIEAPFPKLLGDVNYPYYVFGYDSGGVVTPSAYVTWSSSNPYLNFQWVDSSMVSGANTVFQGMIPGGFVANTGAGELYSQYVGLYTVINSEPPQLVATCDYNSGYTFIDPYQHRYSLDLGQIVQNGGSGGDDEGCSYYGAAIDANSISGDGGYSITLATPGSPAGGMTDTHGRGNGGLEDTNGNPWWNPQVVNVTKTITNNQISAVTIPGLANPYNFGYSTTSRNYAPGSAVAAGSGTGCGAFIKEPTSSVVMQTVTLPNSTLSNPQQYIFGYNQTYGLMNSITYPTGATVTYNWNVDPDSESISLGGISSLVEICYFQHDWPRISSRLVKFDGVNPALEQDFKYQTNWAQSGTGGSRQWTSKITTVTTKDCARNKNNCSGAPQYQTVYNYGSATEGFGMFSGQTPIENEIDYYDYNGSLLKKVYKNWSSSEVLASECTTLPNGMTSGIFYTYAAFDVISDKKEYDFGILSSSACAQGASAPTATPTRETITQYWSLPANQFYPTANMLDRPKSVQVYGNGTLLAETDYVVDVYGSKGIQPATATGHDTNFPTSYTNRGNVTSKTVKCFVGSTSCTNSMSTYAFDQTGQIVSVSDPCGNGTCSDMSGSSHTTSYSYANNYTTLSGNTNSPYSPSVTPNIYLTKSTDPLGHISSFTYDFYSGQLTSATDPNTQTTNYVYADPLGRLTQVRYPDNGQTSMSYVDSSTPSVTTTKLVNSGGTNIISTSTADGMGHPIQTTLSSDPDGPTSTVSSYDGLGRVYQSWNPTRCATPTTNCGETTWGVTTNAYDALGRTISVLEPDGSTVQSAYSSNCTTATDEVGSVRTSCYDGLGRLTQVQEPGPGAQTESPGAATVTIGGSEQSANVKALPGTGTVTIYGNEQSTIYYPCGEGSCPTTLWDQGTVTVTVNGYSAYGGYSQGSTSNSVAQTLLSSSGLNSSQSPVTATLNGSVITLTAKTSGASTDYAISASSSTNYSQYFSSPSFTLSPSGSTLTGGQNAGSTYDSGTVSLVVNNATTSVSYGQGSTSSSIASALAIALTSGSLVTASANGSTITLIADDFGAESNYPLSNSVAWNTEDFASASFTVSAPSALTGGSNGGLGSSPLTTLYTYDALGNLTCAVQKGTDTTNFTTCAAASANWRPRSFSYDSLSHLLSATNPESGTISYTYDLNGNLATRVAPTPDQTGTAKTTHSYTYDVENRELQETHAYSTDGTDKFAYDGSTNLTACGQNPPTISGTNLVHRRSQMCASNSGSSWSYDPMGRPILESRTNYGSVRQKYSVSYSYNKDGSLATITYPSTNVVTYTVGGAGRVTQVSDPANTYVTSPQGGGPMYAPGGQLVGMTSGSQIATSNAYNSRQQPIFLTAGTSGNTVLSRCYDFHSASAINSGQCQFNAYGSGNNGNVFQILDKVNSNNSAVFSYDLLNRITQANTISTTAPCWGENYTIDYWGNLTNIAGVTSMPSCMTETLSAAPATTLNQLTAYCYDAAGNMLQTGVCPTGSFTPTWAYDVENRLSSTAGYSYYYDADGARMEKSAGATGTMYWPGHGGEYLTEAAVNGTINAEYIYFAGKRLARMDQPNGQVHYYFSDHLASTSVITDTNSNIQSQYYYYPFGGSQSSSGSDPNHYKFTGKERDSESGLDMFGARYYFSSFGRFVTPDWAAAPTAVPYAAFGDPQSLNLYGYVRNNPLARRDVDGHDWWQKLKNWYGDPGCWCEGEEADKAAAVNRAKAQAQKAEDLRRWNIIMRDPAKAQMFMGLAMAGVGLGEGEAIISPGAEASPVGQGEESPTPQEGASDPLQSINTGKNIKNWETPSTPDQVGSNLESQGFTKGTASDGSIRYTKGNMEYTMYPKSQTTGGPSMQVKIDGTVVAKVRMQ